MTKGKILQVITGLAYGGAEHQLVQLVSLLRLRGWDISVVSILQPTGYAEQLALNKVPYYSLGIRRGVPDSRAIVRLLAIIDKIRPELVHSHMYHANILARVAKSLTNGPPLICTAHSIDEGGLIRNWVYRLTDRFADLTTQVSRAGLSQYVRIGAASDGRIIFIPNGVDIEFFRPNTEVRNALRSRLEFEGRFVWLAVGRLEVPKNYPCMFHAFAKIAKGRDDLLLAVAGQGRQSCCLKELIGRLGLDNRVVLLGLRRDISQLLTAADAYVMSSDCEGLPLVLLEASACELPIVATNVGGNAEIVQHGTSGFLVQPADSDALASAMAHLMCIPAEERAAMGRAARLYVKQNYSIDIVADRWETIYMKMIRHDAYF